MMLYLPEDEFHANTRRQEPLAYPLVDHGQGLGLGIADAELGVEHGEGLKIGEGDADAHDPGWNGGGGRIVRCAGLGRRRCGG